MPIRLDTFRAMNDNAMPAPPVDIDPRHAFLTAEEVIPRYGGRTYGYLILGSTGFPRRIGHASGSTP